MTRFHRHIIIPSIILLSALRAAAQGSVAFKMAPPAEGVVLAEPFTLSLEASFPEKYAIKPDTSAIESEDFEITSFIRKTDSAAGGTRTDSFEIHAKAFTLGKSTFPAIGWILYAGDGSTAEAKSPSFPIDVQPIFEKTEGEIKDIYKPFRYIPWLWILAALALTAILTFVFHRYRASKNLRSQYLSSWKDPRTPYQRARRRMDALIVSPLAASGKIKEYYTGLSSVLRLYLCEEFTLDASLMTTGDLAKVLKNTGADLKTTLKVREFLNKADMVKFAKMLPPKPAEDADTLGELLGEFARTAETERARAAAKAAETAAKAGGKT